MTGDAAADAETGIVEGVNELDRFRFGIALGTLESESLKACVRAL
jgi:hypothetical protein